MEEKVEEWKKKWKNGRKCGRMEEKMEEWKKKWKNGRKNGRMEGLFLKKPLQFCQFFLKIHEKSFKI